MAYDKEQIVGYAKKYYNLCADPACFEGDEGAIPIKRKDAHDELPLICDSCGIRLLEDEFVAEEEYYKAEYMREKALAIEVIENESVQDYWDQLVDEVDNLRKEAKERE